MVLAVGAVESVVHVQTDVAVEEVGVADTTTEGLITTVNDKGSAENVDGGTSAKALAAGWRRWRRKLGSFGVLTGVGRTCNGAGGEDRESDECVQCFHVVMKEETIE